jgi:hypothetical protein
MLIRLYKICIKISAQFLLKHHKMHFKNRMRSQILRILVSFLFIAVFSLGFNFLRFFMPANISNHGSSIYANRSHFPVIYTKVPIKVFPSRRDLITDFTEKGKLGLADFKQDHPGQNHYFSTGYFPLSTQFYLTGYRLQLSNSRNFTDISSSVLAKYCILLI